MKKQAMQRVSRVRNHKIGIYLKENVRDDDGYKTEKMVLQREVWARVRGLRGNEFYQAKQAQSLDVKTFNFDYFEGLTTKHFIRFKGSYYNIEHPNNIEERNFEYEVKASEVSPSEQ